MYGCPAVQYSTRASTALPPAGHRASFSASARVKSVKRIRFPTLNGLSRVSEINSAGVATPSRQMVRRSRSGRKVRAL